ncbi:phenylacetate--CoA ligase family protein [Methanobacterium formicicum]|uniref:phenylacetate--CoA ligase family protein n=1 Tax=Methanobacterium formicicum TaxID=2162 RepID=UPI002412D6B0|nr:hypothetical protein [Methanobacterium formicicum]MDG3547076.1 hypothetical protein [Methanobacterium formicicum]
MFANIIPINYRLGGKNFIQTYKFLQKSEMWDEEQIKKFQEKQLKKLLEHAKNHVPYYKDVKLVNDPFRSLENFPIIEKEIIQEDMKKFVSDNIPRNKAYYVSTGGTSGNQLDLYLDNSTYAKEWAFVMNAWKRVGFKPGDKLISFRGVEFKKSDKGIFWHHNPIYCMLEMSPFHLSDENLLNYIKKIKKFGPKFIHGYPSAISILADYLERKNEQIPGIRAILAVSENIYPWQRDKIEKTFNARLFSFYGQSERVIFASECEKNDQYHVYPEYGFTEIVDKNNVHTDKNGGLVGTSFLNYYMPFIRYKTGDHAQFDIDKCVCGRNHRIIKNLIGRWNQEMVIGKDNSLISVTALNLHSNILKNIHKYQFYQDTEGVLIVRIISKEKFDATNPEKIKESLNKKTGSNLDILIEEVETIPLTKRGKHQMLIQKIKT